MTDLSYFCHLLPLIKPLNWELLLFVSTFVLQSGNATNLSTHSMTRANLNKSVWLVTNTTTASKYIPKRTRIWINWNPPFRSKFTNSKSTSKCEHWETRFTSYFDALVVFVTSQTLLFGLALAILWTNYSCYCIAVY